MSDIHAALGLNQLRRLDDFLSSRSRAAEYYCNMLAQLSLTLPVHEVNYPDAHRSSSHHLYPILVESSDIRRSVFDFLRSRDIGVNVHYLPIYMQPFYRHLGFEEGYCPVAEDYYKRAISLPLYPDLSTGQLDTVVSAVTDSLS
jgi:dTDP-4-amino-4,6-dideoxygalactose transaminase